MLKILASFCLAICALVAMAQPTYSASVVSGAPNSILQEAECMNGLGQVGGAYYDPNTGIGYAYVIDPFGNFFANLGTLAAKNNGFDITGINVNGMACGNADIPGSGGKGGSRPTQEGVVFTGGAGQLIGFLPGATDSETVAINDAGQVVGSSGRQPFFWDPVNGMQSVPDEGFGSQIYGLNQAGVACGTIGNFAYEGSVSDGALFTPTSYTDLGGLPGADYTVVEASDLAGDAVGFSDIGANNHAALFTGGTVRDLGGLPSTSPYPDSRATGINDAGEIVGFTDVALSSGGDDVFHAWIIYQGTMYDLNDICPVPGDTLTQAWGFNENGQILCEGDNDFYVLTPYNTVTVSASPASAGSVTGGGTALVGTSMTATATAVPGAQFVNWTVNGTVVSTSATYNFTVGQTENLVANFQFLNPSLTISNTHLTGGSSATAYMNLGAIAAADTTFTLTETPSDVTIPASVTVLAGTAQASFTVTALPVDATTVEHINAKLGGLSYNLKFNVQAPVLTSVSSLGSQTCGNPVSVLISLSGPAGPSGVPVSLNDNNTALDVSVGTVTVPSGQSTLTVMLPTNPVAANVVVTLNAVSGSVTVSCTVGVRAAVLKNITLTSNSGVGGVYAPTGTVNMNGTVFAATTVYLTSSDPSITVPASVVVPASASTVDFPVTSSPVSVITPVTIYATCGSVTTNRVVTVKP